MIEIGELQTLGDARVTVAYDQAATSILVQVGLWRARDAAPIPTHDVEARALDDSGAPLKPILLKRYDFLLEFRSTAYAQFDFAPPAAGRRLAAIEIRYKEQSGRLAVAAPR